MVRYKMTPGLIGSLSTKNAMTVPPPWTLTGRGLVFITHFPESFVRAHGFLQPYQQTAYQGWIGTVILADYQTSTVGPYQELLFIPGLFRFGQTTAFSISKIYVSTQESVTSGRANWGIPKERADFRFESDSSGQQHISVSKSGKPVFSVRTKAWGPRVPITTRLLPGFRVVQESWPPTEAGHLLLTAPVASGLARLTSLTDLTVDAAQFPDLRPIKPLLTLTIDDLKMTFPIPKYVGF